MGKLIDFIAKETEGEPFGSFKYGYDNDPTLLEECDAERHTMDTILAHLKRDGHPLERWYYGHFHNSWHSEIDGVWYKMLDIKELLEVPRILSGTK